MNFIINLPPSKYKGTIYNTIFIVINRFIKIIKYIFIIIKIDTVQLAEVFYSKIIYRYSIPNSIISNRDFSFINTFQSVIYFYSKIK